MSASPLRQPVKRGRELLEEIEQTSAPAPVLWWLGHCGFVVKYGTSIIYIDPYLSNSQEARYRRSGPPHPRLMSAPLHPALVRHASLLLATHAHQSHLDPGTAPAILAASPRARLVLPRSAAGRAHMMGIDYLRMTTMDAGQRLEFAGADGEVIRIDAIASAHESLDWTEREGHPYLGYILRLGDCAIYHAGDCAPYDGLAGQLLPYAIDVAMLPINGRDAARGMPGNFTIAEAAALAEEARFGCLVPMHYGMFAVNDADPQRFIDHLLGHRPSVRFKLFECGECWALPPGGE